jgi:hypothetical protein
LQVFPARCFVLCGVDRWWVLSCLPDKYVEWSLSFSSEQYKEKTDAKTAVLIVECDPCFLVCCLIIVKELKCCVAE